MKGKIMYKDATFKQKFVDLEQWLPQMIESIKKDLKQDHLKKDIYFVKKFLPTTNLAKITTEEMVDAYTKAIQEEEKGEQVGEFLASRWLVKHSDVYDFFEKKLSAIAPDFTNIEEIDPSTAKALIEASTKEFGPSRTYLFSVLNSVVFPEEAYLLLRKNAALHQEEVEKTEKEALDRSSRESLERSYVTEISRLTDKYEKKLSGLQKKYITDVEQLKKQVALLQRKLHEAGKS